MYAMSLASCWCSSRMLSWCSSRMLCYMYMLYRITGFIIL